MVADRRARESACSSRPEPDRGERTAWKIEKGARTARLWGTGRAVNESRSARRRVNPKQLPEFATERNNTVTGAREPSGSLARRESRP